MATGDRGCAAWSLVSPAAAASILRLGALFFALYLTSALLVLVDNLLAAHLFGLEEVPQLAAAQRLFALPLMALAVVLTPLWPAYTEAIARGDLAWVGKTLRRTLMLCVGLGGVSALMLACFGGSILQLWVGPETECSSSLLAALAVLLVMQGVGAAIAALLNAAGLIRLQIVLATAFLVAKAGLSVLLARHLGLPGIVWGTVVAYAVVVLVGYAVYVPRILTRLSPRPFAEDQP